MSLDSRLRQASQKLRTDAEASAARVDFDAYVARRDMRRKAASVLAMVALVGVSVLFIVFVLGGPTPEPVPPAQTDDTLVESSTSTTTSVPSTTAPVATSATKPPRVVETAAPAVNPYLEPVFGLPSCSTEAELASWMSETAVSASSPSEFVSASLEDTVARMPVLRGTNAACAAAGSVGELWGWELRDAKAVLLARAVIRPDDGDGSISPEDSPSQQALYFQHTMGSGQGYTGWLFDGGGEAVVKLPGGGFGFLVLEVPGFVVPGTNRYGAGNELLARLLFSQLEPVGMPDVVFLPKALPAGFVRCAGPYYVGGDDFGGSALDFCNADGDVLILTTGSLDPLSSGERTEISGLPATISTTSEGGPQVEVDYRPHGSFVRLEGSPGIDTETLIGVLTSSVALDPRLLQPSGGSGNLRGAFSEEWLTAVLEDAGAEDLRYVDRPGSEGVLVAEFTFRGKELEAFAWVLPDGEDERPLLDTTEIRTLNGVDVFVRRGPEVDGVVPPASQALTHCGGVVFTISLRRTGNVSDGFDAPVDAADPAVDLITETITKLEC